MRHSLGKMGQHPVQLVPRAREGEQQEKKTWEIEQIKNARYWAVAITAS